MNYLKDWLVQREWIRTPFRKLATVYKFNQKEKSRRKTRIFNPKLRYPNAYKLA